MYRTLDTGELHRRHRALVVVHAPPEAQAELSRELRAARPDVVVEILHQSSQDATLLVETPLDGSAPAGLAALPGVLAQHGLVALLDPILAVEGRVRVRFVVPRATDPQEVLRALQDVPRACGFADFRIQRIGTLAPAAHVKAARRGLPPEQESLLALAASMGYYQTPKVVTLEDISRAVGLSISPVHKRLKAAEETIVAQHVAPSPEEVARRRSRNGHGRIEPTSPWEIILRVRGDVGPAAFLAQAPGAHAALHALRVDGARQQAYVLVVCAPEEAQSKLLAALEDRAEVAQLQVVERTSTHVTCRMVTRERGAYALSWWCDTWGNDATLRAIVFENGEAHVRALLSRPHTSERLMARLQACAHAAGWSDWEVVALRSLATGATPPAWPDPLTQRQLEVLRVAHALGYYRTPRGCTLEHVAGTLGVSANAIHKNLVLAESKLIAGYLANGL
ncbi:MAG TPA: helix-turn-helix domain-containing protein [Candidatus Thermoplasmatota archaeon]|nr:helix-turn-helix domain-containing protein [Candidatus Thermoplasmatota archaeon]